MNNAKQALIKNVVKQIVEDINEEIFVPLENLLEDVSEAKLKSFVYNDDWEESNDW